MRRVVAFSIVAVAATLGPAPVVEAAPPPLAIYPSDTLTVADASQLTGRRVNMPMSNCAVDVSKCDETALVNQLDGFDLDPNIKIGFSGPIDLAKVSRSTIYVQRLCFCRAARMPLVRLVWDAVNHNLYGHPKHLLRESSTYRITVTAGINGQSGTRTFTTMSASTGLRQMASQLTDGSAYAAAGIAPADRGLRFVRPGGTRTVYPAANVAMVRRFNDTGSGGLVEETVFNSAFPVIASTYGFGSFLAPSWLDADRRIPQTPTRTGAPQVRGFEEVGLVVILPAGTKPAGGWPTAVFGPGFTRSKYDVFLAADENLRRGIATIAIDPVAHSYGPNSTAGVDLIVPPSSPRFSGYGRGFDQNGDGVITNQEGVSTKGQPSRYASIALRDGLRQTAADNMALVRAIGRGVDVNGDGSTDLKPTGVTYFGQSLGGIYGTLLMGADPLVTIGALNVPGGPVLDIARLSPAFRPLVATELANRIPSLLNGGPGADGFTESQPLYLDPPMTSPYPGSIEIQKAGARTNWINRVGSPEAFAPLERKRPPAGHPVKKVLYQFAFGDRTVPNPTSATLSRAGFLHDIVSFFRNDKTPTAGTDPHGFLLDPRVFPTGRQLGQTQIADFFVSGGTIVNDPDGPAPQWETPIADPRSLETVNF
jgi:hypothetical protein